MSSQKPLTALIINVHSCMNAGDRALLEITVQQLRKSFHGIRIIAASNYPEEKELLIENIEIVASPARLTGLIRTQPFWKQIPLALLGLTWSWIASVHWLGFLRGIIPGKWRELFAAYRSADMVLAVPGNQLHTMGRLGYPLLISAMPVYFAHRFHKPLYVLPQTIGPLRWGWEKTLLRSVYGRARRVFLRDLGSLDLAKKIALPAERVSYAPDPGFLLLPAARETAIEFLSAYDYHAGEPYIGVTIVARILRSMRMEEMQKYYQVMGSVLSRFQEEFKTQIFIFNQVTGPSHNEDDRLAARAVLEKMTFAPGRVKLIEERLEPALLQACYGLMDLFIATRLHSGIFSLNMGVPTIFIGYLPKSRGVLEAVGLSDCLVELKSIDEEELFRKLEKVWLERDELSRRISHTLPGILADAVRPMQQIHQDYFIKKG